MKPQSHNEYDPQHHKVSDDCAEPCWGAEAHDLHLAVGETSGSSAPTGDPQSCFKCLSTDTVPIGKTAPYLAPRLWLCRACIGSSPKQHPKNAEFDCGCAWNDERYVRLDLDHSALVAAPPDENCVACGGTGKIRDRHPYLRGKAHVGAGAQRQGHSYQKFEDPLQEFFPDGGWVIDKRIHATGYRPGRPKTTITDLDVTKIYLTDVINEVAGEHPGILDLDREDFFFALQVLLDLTLHRGRSANPRVLAEWMPMSKATIYRWRKRGERMQNFLQQMDRIENLLQHTAAVDELRWAELFQRVNGSDELTGDESDPVRQNPKGERE